MEVTLLREDGRKATLDVTSIEDLQEQMMLAERETGQKVSLDGSVGGLESAARGGIQGATLNFGDELAGLGAAIVPGGQDYTQSRDENRLNNYIAQQANPKTYLGAELGGSLVLPGGAAGAAAKNAGRLAKTGRYAASGALGGGLAALGSTEELDQNAVRDTLIGTGGGALAGVLGGHAVDKLADVGTNLFRGAQRAVDASPEYGSNRAIREALPEELRTGTPSQLIQAVEAQGPDSRLINIDEGMLNLAQQSRRGGPDSARVMARQLDEQRAGAVGRLQEGVRDAFPDSRHTSLPELDRALRDGTHARELYETAYQNTYRPSDITRRQFEQSPTFQQVAENVQESLLDRDIMAPDLGGELPDEVPVEYMHRFLAMLRGKVDETFRNGNPQHANNLRDIYKNLDREVKSQVPEFAEAQRYYRSKMDIKAASEVGRDIFKGKTQDYELDDIMEGWSETETKAFQVGLMQALLNRVDEITDTGNTGSKVLNNPRVRKLVKQGMGPNGSERLDSLIELAKQEQSKSRVHSRLLNNSSTAEGTNTTPISLDTSHATSAVGLVEFILNKITGHKMTADEWSMVNEKLMSGLTDETAKKILRRPMSEARGFEWLSPMIGTTAATEVGRSDYLTGN